MNTNHFDVLAHVALAVLNQLPAEQRLRARALFGPGGRHYAELRVRFGPTRRASILAIDGETGAASPLTTLWEKIE